MPPGGVFCIGSAATICEGFDTSAGTFAPSGGSWAVADGRYVLCAPLTAGNGVVNNRALHGTPIGGDFAISVRARPTPSASTANDVAVIFGYQNPTNYWLLSLAENNSGGNHGLFRVVNDSLDPGGRHHRREQPPQRRHRPPGAPRAHRRHAARLPRRRACAHPHPERPAGLGAGGVGSINDAASFDDFEAKVIPPPPPFCSGSTATICEDFTSGAGGFATSGGTWGISGGRYTLSAPATGGATGVFNRAIHATAISGDFTAQGSFRPTPSSTTANDVALIFAYASATNYWYVSLAENNSSGNHGIFRVANGVQTQVVDFSSTHRISDGTSYALRLQRTGNLLRVFRNDVQIASTTQTALPAGGGIGLGSINDPASFDDLQVTRP